MRAIDGMLMRAGAAMLALPVSAQAQAPTIYAVIFEVTASADGSDLTDFKVARVADPRKDMTEAVGVSVGQAYLSKAHTMMADKLKGSKGPAGGKPFYTYFFYDPARPAEVLLVPR